MPREAARCGGLATGHAGRAPTAGPCFPGLRRASSPVKPARALHVRCVPTPASQRGRHVSESRARGSWQTGRAASHAAGPAEGSAGSAVPSARPLLPCTLRTARAPAAAGGHHPAPSENAASPGGGSQPEGGHSRRRGRPQGKELASVYMAGRLGPNAQTPQHQRPTDAARRTRRAPRGSALTLGRGGRAASGSAPVTTLLSR